MDTLECSLLAGDRGALWLTWVGFIEIKLPSSRSVVRCLSNVNLLYSVLKSHLDPLLIPFQFSIMVSQLIPRTPSSPWSPRAFHSSSRFAGGPCARQRPLLKFTIYIHHHRPTALAFDQGKKSILWNALYIRTWRLEPIPFIYISMMNVSQTLFRGRGNTCMQQQLQPLLPLPESSTRAPHHSPRSSFWWL